ncbi:MAG: AAA family ATPase [Candidatus Chromulinivorax sp.]
MNYFKNWYLIIMSFTSGMIFADWQTDLDQMIKDDKVYRASNGDLYFRPIDLSQKAPDNRSFAQKVYDVASLKVNSKLDYLGTEKGINDTIDAVGLGLVTVGGSVLTALAVYYAMDYLLNQKQDNSVSIDNAQIYYPGDIKLTFKDVAGLAGAKADMKDVITYLKDPEKFNKVGAKPLKGVLLIGGPGNGKTLLAKAVAGETNVPFVNTTGSAFSSHWIGKSAENVREFFAKVRQIANKHKGCIVFIDEIDSLGGDRSLGHREQNDMVNAFLTEVDGLESSVKYPIIILGATNRIDTIDEAFKRPGRFDRIVNVAKPDIKDRVELLKIAFAKVKTAADINIEKLALATRGFSGAELANLVNEAAILAANAQQEAITMRDVELAFDNITLGREDTGKMQSQEALKKTAYHEAGHTIALLRLDKKNMLHKSSIAPRGGTLGVMRLMPVYESYDLTKEDMLNDIIMSLAGRAAEEVFGFGLGAGAYSDLQRTHALAYAMVAQYGMSDALRNISYSQRGQLPNDIATQVEREIQKIIIECTQKAHKLITDNKKDVEKIAQLLLQKNTVLGEEIYNLLNLQVPKLQDELTVAAQAIPAT